MGQEVSAEYTQRVSYDCLESEIIDTSEVCYEPLQAGFIATSTISGAQAEGMSCTSRVRWGVAADSVGKNSIVSQRDLDNCEVLIEDDWVPLFSRGRDEKRTTGDCDVRDSQEEASKKG